MGSQQGHMCAINTKRLLLFAFCSSSNNNNNGNHHHIIFLRMMCHITILLWPPRRKEETIKKYPYSLEYYDDSLADRFLIGIIITLI